MQILALRNDMQPFLSALGGVEGQPMMRIECSRMLIAIQRAGLHRESMYVIYVHLSYTDTHIHISFACI